MMDSKDRKNVAVTIVQQLGGRRFMAMVGVKTFSFDSTGGISFKIGRNASKANQVAVEYDEGKDLYNLVFYSFRKMELKELDRSNGIDCENLVGAFERYTGLATSL